MDDLETRYGRVRRSAQEFLVIQYGVCTFTWNEKTKKYLAKPFNFPIFPATGSSEFGLHRAFGCHPGALEFLERNGFDFSRWVRTGVPYLNHDDEDRIRHRIGKLSNRSDIPIDDQNREFVESSMSEVREWLQNSTEKVLKVAGHTSYKRRLIHQEVRKRFNSYLRTEGKGLVVEVSRLTVEERNGGSGDVERSLEELNDLVGFRKVIEMISRSKKPVVGHNMYLDLCHTFEKFHKTLPLSVVEFKKEIGKLFPSVYDTKYIAISHAQLRDAIPNTTLSDLFQQCSTSATFAHPDIAIHPDFQSSSPSTAQFHEAGYDAYVTGFSYLRMLAAVLGEGAAGRVRLEDPNLLGLVNRLYLMRSDSPYLNLAGDDDTPTRANLLHLHDLPANWRTGDVQRHLSDLLGPIHVRWINDSSCFIALRDASIADDGVQAILEAQEGGKVPLCLRVETYREYLGRTGAGVGEGIAKKRKVEVVEVEGGGEGKEEVGGVKEWAPNSCVVS
ncbi:hypothetical protein HDU67_000675 [Dinochytrium kinnereticum]|nr:hypothetical protein HDU67_000675 [Dinochytrium kinnereticum]